MKYKTAVIVVSLLLTSAVLIGGARMLSGSAAAHPKQRVVASFYPIYVAALNLTQGADDLEVVNLTGSQTGCLHDFTLRPQDMITLEGASVFLINGGGMESFLEGVAASYPTLPIVDSSTGIELIEDDPAHSLSFEADGDAHDHDGEDAHDHEEEPNAHFWLSPTRYIRQIENLRDGLIAQFPQYRTLLTENAASYIAQVEALRAQMQTKLAPYRGRSAVIFHNAFAYFAEESGITVAETIQVERDTALSSAQVANAIDAINRSGIATLLAEAQYSTELADAIARETHATVYTLDTAVSGDGTADAYLNAMYANLDTLVRAFDTPAD